MLSTDIEKDAKDFVRACRSIQALLDNEPIRPEDRDMIEYSCIDLLSKLRLKKLRSK